MERKFVDKEYYFAILMDRKSQGPAIVASSEGGVDIEGVARDNPSAIITLPVDIRQGTRYPLGGGGGLYSRHSTCAMLWIHYIRITTQGRQSTGCQDWICFAEPGSGKQNALR